MTGTLTRQQIKLAEAMTHRELEDSILDLARKLGWTVFGARDSRAQALEGLPDKLFLRGHRSEWWELKREPVAGRNRKTTHPTLIQEDVMEQLRVAGHTVRLVRPSDYMAGRVAEWLR